MIQTRIVIRPSRHVRDIYRGRRYSVVARFPGGREIPLAKTQTRQQAFRVAQEKSAPSGSPTAGALGGYVDGTPSVPHWKNPRDPIFHE